jgi:hypothetical protein
MREFLIWSLEHDAWWRPAHGGYTRLLAEAGRYPEDQAAVIIAAANRKEVLECLIPVDCVVEGWSQLLDAVVKGECLCRSCTHPASKHTESGSCRVCGQEGCWS